MSCPTRILPIDYRWYLPEGDQKRLTTVLDALASSWFAVWYWPILWFQYDMLILSIMKRMNLLFPIDCVLFQSWIVDIIDNYPHKHINDPSIISLKKASSRYRKFVFHSFWSYSCLDCLFTICIREKLKQRK